MKRDGTYTPEIEETQLHDARQSKRIRDMEAENALLTGQVVYLNQRVLNLEQQLAHARAHIAELSRPLCASSREAAQHETNTALMLERM